MGGRGLKILWHCHFYRESPTRFWFVHDPFHTHEILINRLKQFFLVLFLHSNTKNNSDCLLSTFRLANAYEWVRGRRIWSYMYLSQDLNRRGKWHAPVWKKPATRTWTINSIAVLLIHYTIYMGLFQFYLIFENLKRKLMGNWIILKVAWIHN